jgi:hypothetical protein
VGIPILWHCSGSLAIRISREKFQYEFVAKFNQKALYKASQIDFITYQRVLCT